MDNKTLLKISLSCSLIGIFLLLIISERIDISESNIANITNKEIDKTVKIKGHITRLTKIPGLYLINVKDETGEILVIVFNEEEIEITKNSLVEIEGKVKQYNEILEINAELIRVY